MKYNQICQFPGKTRTRAVVARAIRCILFLLIIAIAVANPWRFEFSTGDAQTLRPRTETSQITPDDLPQQARFGASIAVDGDTLVVGAPGARTSQNVNCGAVYVYTRLGASWAFQSKLLPPTPTFGMRFGESIAINENTIVVGTPNENWSVGKSGTAYIFTRTGSNWEISQRLTGSGELYEHKFAASVDIQGNIIAVGSTAGAMGGAVFVFTYNGTSWLEATRLSDGPESSFGTSVSLSGETLAIGAPTAGFDFTLTGLSYVYAFDGNAWQLQQKFRASDTDPYDNFGYDVALENDTLLVGAIYAGAAYIFTRTNGVWVQRQKFTSSTGSTAQFGRRVRISGDRLIVGNALMDVNGVSHQGAAEVYVRNDASWSLQNLLIASNGGESDQLGTDVAIAGTEFFAGAPGFIPVAGGPRVGSVYYFIQAPRPPDLRAAVDTGVSNTDNITNEENLVFDINGVTPGAVVDLLRNGSVVDSKPATANSVHFNDSPPANDTYQYAARETVGGLLSSTSGAVAVKIDTIAPPVVIDQGPSQIDPTTSTTVYFVLNYWEPLAGFETSDISFEGSSADLSNITVTYTNSPVANSLKVENIVSDGQVVRASIPPGAVTDLAGNPNVALASTNDTVTVDNVRPRLAINQSSGQGDPATSLPLRYSAVFSEPVTGFTANLITLTSLNGNSTGAIVNLTGGGAVYEITVTNLALNGSEVRASSFPSGVRDAYGNDAMSSTSTDNVIFLDNVGPVASIAPAPGQANPTSGELINFRVIFNESVTDFTAADISLAASTANISSATLTVTGSGTTYNVSVTNFTSNGQIVRASVVAGAVVDSFGNPSSPSSSAASVTVDNVMPTVTIEQLLTQPDPATAQPIEYRVVFSEPVFGLTAADVVFVGSTADTSLAAVAVFGSGSSYTISVSNIISSGIVRTSLAAGAANDSLGNLSALSESVDNEVTLQLPAVSSITGRVTSLAGRGLGRVRIQVSLSSGEQIFTQTNPFGFYRVANVRTGEISIQAIKKDGTQASDTFYLLADSVKNFSFLF